MGKALSPKQLEGYERDGVLFPVAALSDGEVRRFRAAFEDFAARFPSRPKSTELGQCHLSLRWAWDLVTHRRILDAVEDLIGGDILVHSSTIFCKYPRDPGFVSWHQDGYYWGLSAPRLTSAWVALADSTVENGCLRVVPGSHHEERYPHEATARHEHNILGSGLEVTVEVDESQAADVVLKAGETSFHHVSIIHGSNPNRSDTYRIGFAIRYLATDVTQKLEHHHPVIAARGRTDVEHYELAARPPERDPAKEFAAQTDFARRLQEVRRRQGRQG